MGYRRAFLPYKTCLRLLETALYASLFDDLVNQRVSHWRVLFGIPPDARLSSAPAIGREGTTVILEHASFPARTPADAAEEDWAEGEGGT